jgi:hypothetical protein
MADNYGLHVNCDNFDVLKNVINVAFQMQGRNTKAKSYMIHPNFGIILYWVEKSDHTNKDNIVSLPNFNAEQTFEFVKGWLEQQKKENYSDFNHILKQLNKELENDDRRDKYNTFVSSYYNDGDVTNREGFSLTTGNFWGIVNGSHYSICAITPSYCWYGK